MRLLFVAADSMEYAGILTRVREAARLDLNLHWARSGRLGEHEVLLAANGAGPKRAAEAARQGWRHLRPDAIVSTGFCGALDQSLRIADVVSATAVNAHPARPLAGATPFHSGAVRSIDHVARTAAEKAQLRESGARAVEMEAAAVAGLAAEWRAAFHCIRAVTDLADEDLVNDFNSCLRLDGHFDTMKLLAGALRQPAVRLPELLRLRKRCVLAARSLGDFFADCRF